MQADDRAFVVARLHVALDCSDRAAVAAAWPPDTLGFGNQTPQRFEHVDLLSHQQSSQLASQSAEYLSSRGDSSQPRGHPHSSQSVNNMVVLKVPGVQGAVMHRKPPEP